MLTTQIPFTGVLAAIKLARGSDHRDPYGSDKVKVYRSNSGHRITGRSALGKWVEQDDAKNLGLRPALSSQFPLFKCDLCWVALKVAFDNPDPVTSDLI